MKHILVVTKRTSQYYGPFDSYDDAMEYWTHWFKTNKLVGFTVEVKPLNTPEHGL